MIKIKTKFYYDGDLFELANLKYKDSCSLEFLALIHALVNEIVENDDELNKKCVYKILKEMDEMDEKENKK